MPKNLNLKVSNNLFFTGWLYYQRVRLVSQTSLDIGVERHGSLQTQLSQNLIICHHDLLANDGSTSVYKNSFMLAA